MLPRWSPSLGCCAATVCDISPAWDFRRWLPNPGHRCVTEIYLRMKTPICLIFYSFLLSLALAFSALPLAAYSPKQSMSSAASTIRDTVDGNAQSEVVPLENLPETPAPHFERTVMISESQGAYEEQNAAPASSSAAAGSSTTSPAGQSGVSSGTAEPSTPAQRKSQKALAEEQIRQQQKQRVLGVVPNFNTRERCWGMRSFRRCCTRTRVTSASDTVPRPIVCSTRWPRTLSVGTTIPGNESRTTRMCWEI